MSALLYDCPVPPLEYPKDAAPGATPVLGSYVYVYTVARALARHGTYDAYYYLDRNPLASARADYSDRLPSRARVSAISVDSLDDLARHEQLVLMTPRSSPQGLVSLRACLGHPPRPITSCIHSLSGIGGPYLAMSLMFANLDAHDAVLCSTHAGRRVVERLLDLVIDALDGGEGRRARPRVQLPVIPLGTDCQPPNDEHAAARRRLAIPEDAILLLYIGRLSASTKCDLGPLLVTFARHLHDPANRTRLVIAGDDTQYGAAGAIREWCAALGCQSSVSVVPDVTNAERRALLSAADVFLSLSDNIQETFGLTIIEAMAAGLPVVASDWDGYRELVKHGVTGFLVPTAWPVLGERFDLSAPPAISETLNAALASATMVDCDAAADYLKLLVADGELRKTMGAAAMREARARFDWPVIVKQYEELWSELLAQAARPSVGTRLAIPGPMAYRCQDVFAAYATGVIHDDTPLTLSGTGEWWLARGMPLEALPGTPSGFRDELSWRLGQAVADAGQLTIDDLLRRERSSGVTDLAVRLHIGRLLKYGILRRAPDAPRWEHQSASALQPIGAS